ncbi:MAG: hypothetical protein HY756_08310 [Nitrospirae bacterium]|nr:hypothetical protein [Nitrospirota bacterium]
MTYPLICIAGILIAVLAAFKKSPFFNFLGILIAIYGGLNSVSLVMPPLPGQVVTMYMAMSVFAFLIYFSIQEETFKAFLEPMRAVLADDNKKFLRLLIVFIAIPLLAGYITYVKVKPKFEPPVSARIVHPEPPNEMDFKGKTIKVLGLENPLRKDTANLAKNIEDGNLIPYLFRSGALTLLLSFLSHLYFGVWQRGGRRFPRALRRGIQQCLHLRIFLQKRKYGRQCSLYMRRQGINRGRGKNIIMNSKFLVLLRTNITKPHSRHSGLACPRSL